jgi:hypothetical protein
LLVKVLIAKDTSLVCDDYISIEEIPFNDENELVTESPLLENDLIILADARFE